MNIFRYSRLRRNAGQTRQVMGEAARIPFVRTFLQRVYRGPVSPGQIQQDAGALHMLIGYFLPRKRRGPFSRRRSSWLG